MSTTTARQEVLERINLQYSLLAKTGQQLTSIMAVFDDALNNDKPIKEAMFEIVLAANSANSNINCLLDYFKANLNAMQDKGDLNTRPSKGNTATAAPPVTTSVIKAPVEAVAPLKRDPSAPTKFIRVGKDGKVNDAPVFINKPVNAKEVFDKSTKDSGIEIDTEAAESVAPVVQEMPLMKIVQQTHVPKEAQNIIDAITVSLAPKESSEFTPQFDVIEAVVPMGICERLMTAERSPLNGIFTQSPITPHGRGKGEFGEEPWLWHTKKNLEHLAYGEWLYAHQGFYGTGDTPTRVAIRGKRFMIVWDFGYTERSVYVWAVGLSEENKDNPLGGWFYPNQLSATYLYNLVKEIEVIASAAA
jgi:hypothetical protein